MCWPPFIATLLPVMNAADSLQINATSAAISEGRPRRPTGMRGMICDSSTSLGTDITIFVSRYPGDTVFTVTPLFATSSASDIVRPCMPAFAAASSGLESLAKDQIRIEDLDLALGELNKLTPLAKSRLLQACVAGIWSDQRASALEVELFRAFAGALDCPIPPVMAV
jgi:hypothetical protein